MDISAPLNPSDLFSAAGLVIVITGGGTGLGLATASAVTRSGAKKVYILGRRLNVLQQAVSQLTPTGGSSVVPIVCDVADIESVKRAAQLVERETGYVDVLINNAGVSGPRHNSVYEATSVHEVQETLLGGWERWESTMAINTAAVAGVSGAFLHLLDAANVRRGFVGGKIEPGEGSRRRNTPQEGVGVEIEDVRTAQIITVASIAGFNRHITAGLAYTASKAGAIAIGKSLGTMLSPWGIRSNLICPGLFPSEMTAGSMKEQYSVNEIPAHRGGSYEEFAGTILYIVGKAGHI